MKPKVSWGGIRVLLAVVATAVGGAMSLRGEGDIPGAAAGESAGAQAGVGAPAGGEEKEEAFDATEFFKRHFFPYEPFYFIAWTESPNAKFQISFRYQIVNSEGALARHWEWTEGFNMGYSQTSLWDWNEPSAPFFDSSYRPELMYVQPHLWRPGSFLTRVGVQTGFQHESNGKGGGDSRSLNIAYVRVPLVFGPESHFHVMLEPRAWAYVGGLSDNPDLADYRGYADLRVKTGWGDGLMLDVRLRLGDDGQRGSSQFDLTFPLHHLWGRSLSLYLQAQYFTGYGESLLRYDERDDSFRAGFALFR